MKFTKEVIDDLAAKLLIGLSAEENEMVRNEFERIEKDMNLLSEIDGLNSVEPLTHPFAIDDIILREDDEIEELTKEEVLLNAECKNSDAVIVPKVVG